MAPQKPRYGGAQNSMDDFKQLYMCNTNMAPKSEAQGSTIPVSTSGSVGLTNVVSETQKLSKVHVYVESGDSLARSSNKFDSGETSDAAETDVRFCKRGADSEDANVGRDVSFRASVCQRDDTEHLQHLMQVFEELGIKSKTKPYSRYRDKSAGVSGHVESQPELPPTPSFMEANRLFEDNTVVYCKNLFLKDRRGQFYIVVCQEEHLVDLKMLKQRLKTHRNLSFGDDVALRTVLQLKPGEVTPLAIMHQSAKDVRVAVYSHLAEAGEDVKFAFHPLCGHLQVELSYSELVAFVEYFGRTVEIIADETLMQSKETPNKHRSLASVKTKQNSGNKLVGRETKNKNSCHGQQRVEQCSATVAGPNENVKGALSGETTSTSADPNALSEHNRTLSSKNKDISAIAAAEGATFTLLAEVHTRADCEESGQNMQFHMACSRQFLNVNHERKLGKTVSEEQELDHDQTHTETGVSDGNYTEKTISLRQELGLGGSEKVMPGKPRKRIFLSRKGKLRSYVKKSAQEYFDTEASSGAGIPDYAEVHENDNVEAQGIDTKADRAYMSEDEILVYHRNPDKAILLTKNFKRESSTERLRKSFLKADICYTSAHKITSTPPQVQNQENLSAELDPEHSQQVNIKLEIVNQFYSSLDDSKVTYDEIDLSDEGGGTTIRPSVGCRCFLLKDKGGNFFFIISHELYELDFGRLKAALKPKKKLMAAHPADIITVLGVDPMKVSPFAVLTMRYPQLRVYITRKILAPNIMLCIQHPFAQARRILLTSAQLQKYFNSLGIIFGAVEERHWNARFNFPFSQFDRPKEGSGPTPNSGQEVIPETSTGEGEGTNKSKLRADLNESHKNLLSAVFANVDFSQYVAAPLQFLAQNTFPFFIYTRLFNKTSKMSKNASSVQGSPVDPPILQTAQQSREINGIVDMHSSAQLELHNISVPMTMADLENHLLSHKIIFDLKKGEHQGDISTAQHNIARTNAIIEHCTIMHLTNSTGHNFLIIGARDDFPMSVKRFCRRSRIREHLDIRIDPQEENGNRFLDDIAPGMMPFALAFAGRRAVLWDRFRFMPNTRTSGAIARTSNPRELETQIIPEQSIKQMVCPAVTVALTTTLYIDPETVMEFRVGQERSRLRMTSSEFEKYAREVGFEIIYY